MVLLRFLNNSQIIPMLQALLKCACFYCTKLIRKKKNKVFFQF